MAVARPRSKMDPADRLIEGGEAVISHYEAIKANLEPDWEGASVQVTVVRSSIYGGVACPSCSEASGGRRSSMLDGRAGEALLFSPLALEACLLA